MVIGSATEAPPVLGDGGKGEIVKQKHLIVQNILTHGACIHVNRNEWNLEIIRDPRPSCLDRWKLRNTLRELAPGETRFVNGIQVHKHLRNYSQARYVIDGRVMKFDEAIAFIEAERQAA